MGNRGETMKLFGLFLVAFSVEAASTYPRGNRSCDHGRKFLCKYCGESCGQARCPEDPKPEEYQFPDQFPDCNWGCYCPDDKIWSPMHNDCLDGDYDQFVMELATTPIKSFPLIASPVRDGKRFPVTMVAALVAVIKPSKDSFNNKVQSKTDL